MGMFRWRARRNGGVRLDPVRRRRPSGGTLLRLVAVSMLLGVAAYASWSPTRSCTDVIADPSPASPAAAATPSGSVSLPSSAAASGAASGVVPSGSVGVPVRLADPTALSLVRPGNRVDLLRVGDEGGPTPVATAALVLRVTGPDDPATGGLLLALAPAEARHAVAAPGQTFAIIIWPG